MNTSVMWKRRTSVVNQARCFFFRSRRLSLGSTRTASGGGATVPGMGVPSGSGVSAAGCSTGSDGRRMMKVVPSPLDDALTDREAQAGALLLRGEEWHEDAHLLIRRNAGPVVRDLHLDELGLAEVAEALGA